MCWCRSFFFARARSLSAFLSCVAFQVFMRQLYAFIALTNQSIFGLLKRNNAARAHIFVFFYLQYTHTERLCLWVYRERTIYVKRMRENEKHQYNFPVNIWRTWHTASYTTRGPVVINSLFFFWRFCCSSSHRSTTAFPIRWCIEREINELQNIQCCANKKKSVRIRISI